MSMLELRAGLYRKEAAVFFLSAFVGVLGGLVGGAISKEAGCSSPTFQIEKNTTICMSGTTTHVYGWNWEQEIDLAGRYVTAAQDSGYTLVVTEADFMCTTHIINEGKVVGSVPGTLPPNSLTENEHILFFQTAVNSFTLIPVQIDVQDGVIEVKEPKFQNIVPLCSPKIY